jgi:hypothetical protein
MSTNTSQLAAYIWSLAELLRGTPRDIVRLTTSLVFMEDDEALRDPGIIRGWVPPDSRVEQDVA